jgi:Domain of unknown function (DUF3303)
MVPSGIEENPMKFMVQWSIDQDKWIPIMKVWSSMTAAQRADAGDGVKLVGRWHDVNGRTGVAILETSDAAAMGRYLNQWNTMCNLQVAPVLGDEESAAVAKTSLANLGA